VTFSNRVQYEHWGLRLVPNSQHSLTLYWFHHAGGNAPSLIPWLSGFPEDWEIVVPHYSRRTLGGASVVQIARHLAGTLPLIKEAAPIVALGHSMGGLVAFELLRTLRHERRSEFSGLVVSAVRAASHFVLGRRLMPLSEKSLMDLLRRTEVTPEVVLNDEVMRRILLEDLRLDYASINKYVYREYPPLSLPIVAVSGSEDSIVPPLLMKNWQAETTAKFSFYGIRGGHFYYVNAPAAARQLLVSKIRMLGYP